MGVCGNPQIVVANDLASLFKIGAHGTITCSSSLSQLHDGQDLN